jgi:Methyltransferase domain
MTFHDTWFHPNQAAQIAALAAQVHERGICVEIGCWEGFSTHYIANAIHPTPLYAVDTWRGNEDESADHPSVLFAKERDVYATFEANMRALTKGNVIAMQLDWRDAITLFRGGIAFLHIDAAHDYTSMIDMLVAWYPKMLPGGIICGDDYKTASSSRADLQGGVERAVTEYFQQQGLTVHTDHNAWWVYVS